MAARKRSSKPFKEVRVKDMIVPDAENANSIEVDDTFTSTLWLFSAPLLVPDERRGE